MLAEGDALLDLDHVPPERRASRRALRCAISASPTSCRPRSPAPEDWAACWPACSRLPCRTHETLRRWRPAAVEIASFDIAATGLIDIPELPGPAAGGEAAAGSYSRRPGRAAASGRSPGEAARGTARRQQGRRVAVIEAVSPTTMLYSGDRHMSTPPAASSCDPTKSAAASLWCEKMSATVYGEWRYLFSPQKQLEAALAIGAKSLAEVAEAFVQSKQGPQIRPTLVGQARGSLGEFTDPPAAV
jgi:hypothetical protein